MRLADNLGMDADRETDGAEADPEAAERKRIGREIRAARDAKGLSQPALAKLLGVDKSTISHWESGRNGPRPAVARRLWAALDPAINNDSPPDSRSNDSVAVMEIDAEKPWGAGSMDLHRGEGLRWSFPVGWVRNELKASDANALLIVPIAGDSMVSNPPSWNDLHPGDRVIVNSEDRTPSPPGFFAVSDGFAILIKRASIVSDSGAPEILFTCNNTAYPAYRRPVGDDSVVGRVIGRWQRL